uniref:Peroxisomal N(1)-acetyl-spermine/spermidine oxidase-like n=1 Tax=Saccoglossus kowalevskii TaxID=10224 RepID=A0ABM0M5W7_SACKO|nr:PREDICTED: peroxisomal N(1)-acetyl-spermine/spermidine oxidase-like [Saccoglossus kowalevskii]
MSEATVVVIGAGIAGLSAAKELIENGITDVKLLEASDRIGGRILQCKVVNSGLLEMGANWIHGTSNNPVHALAAQHQLFNKKLSVTRTQSNGIQALTSQGTQIDSDIVEKIEHFYYSSLDETKTFHEKNKHSDKSCEHNHTASVGEFLNKTIIDYSKSYFLTKQEKSFYECLLNLECCISGCNSMNDVALIPFGEYVELPGEHRILPSGYESLIKAIQKGIPQEKIWINMTVSTIHWGLSKITSSKIAESNSGDNVEVPNIHHHNCPVYVQCEDGVTLPADHVIVTSSLGFLKEHVEEFLDPRLPDDKIQAIRALGFGTVGKIYLHYDVPWWSKSFTCFLVWDEDTEIQPGDAVKQQGLWYHKLYSFGVVVTNPNVVVGWLAGQQAEHMETLSESEGLWYHKLYSFGVVVTNPNVVVGWLAGQQAEHMETLSESEVGITCTAILRKFFSRDDIPEPQKVNQTSWYSNPYTRGSYSYVAVGSSGDDIDILSKPLPYSEHMTSSTQHQLQVLFAGEATHRTFYSTTHGALLSGQREADRILSLYKSQITSK